MIRVSRSRSPRPVITLRPQHGFGSGQSGSVLVHQLRDEAANPRSMQREGDAVGGDVNAVDQQAEDARLLGRIQLVPHRLKRAKRLDGLSWDAR
jgi:hypothetical protein